MRVAVVALCLLSANCEGRSLDLERMIDQKRFRPYERCDYFPDGRVMRTPPAATRRYDQPARPSPRPNPTWALVRQGQSRYETHCGTCHGVLGDGDSEVATYMELRKPPSLLEAAVRQLEDQKIYQIVTRGYGLMPSYADVLTEPDRWAVIYYIRALEHTEPHRLSDLPPAIRSEAERALK